ncbi:YkgJ family cysteine cluster protein [bacterium]|nr:YkgJ family cysteine cluster protein [bacterium]MBP9806890.1 YkgJ family cysteine cluster protein [bacterium]
MALTTGHKTIDVDGKILHIPEGINYSCAGCGRCCNGVAVPMTQDDYERVSAIDWSKELPQFDWSRQFRMLSSKENDSSTYTHAIRPTDDGHCPFLINKLCHIHATRGEHVKPLICGLFPYSFNSTPSGVYLTVSFRSNAVLGNMGTPLTEQIDTLKEKFAVYNTLYTARSVIWDAVKLTVDKPISWEQYLDYEEGILAALVREDLSLKERIFAASDSLFKDINKPPLPDTIAPPKGLDKKFLAGLFALYFPNDPKYLNKDVVFNGISFALDLALKSPKFKVVNRSYSFEELTNFPWPESSEIDDLLTRFLYSRVFGKWYFGGGFAQLSVIAGFHHLALLMPLMRMHAAGLAIARGAAIVELIDVMVTIRQLEEKVQEAVLDGYSAALWELILFAPGRLRRLLSASI